MPSPIPAKTIGDSLPILPSPVESLPTMPLPVVPSLVPGPDMDGTSCHPTTKASMKAKPANKCSNAKSTTMTNISKPSATADTIMQSASAVPTTKKRKAKKAATTKPVPNPRSAP
ncbi:hypothetical protein BDR04DRAFT_1162177 [Suillus decipiens]|nr:hypothetical protein BDR04DRAFT_1162177 [Suillus decipiens]